MTDTLVPNSKHVKCVQICEMSEFCDMVHSYYMRCANNECAAVHITNTG